MHGVAVCVEMKWNYEAQTMTIRTFPVSYGHVSKSYRCYPSVHDLFVLAAKNWGTTDKKHLLITYIKYQNTHCISEH